MIAAIVLFFGACQKDIDLGDPPSLDFKSGGKYTSTDKAIKSGDVLVFGITGSNNGSRDKLAKLVIRIAIDSQDYVTRKTIVLPEAENENYEEDFSFKLVTTGKQKINVILTNTHGLQAEKSLTFTVAE